MRHRLGGIGRSFHIGLGNSSPEILGNNWTQDASVDKMIVSILKDGLKTFPLLKKSGYSDFGISNRLKFGVEPAYMYNPIELVCIDFDRKEYSYHLTGYSWGAWGSGIRSTTRYYKDFKYKSKFIRFIDKWHPKILALVEKHNQQYENSSSSSPRGASAS